MNNDKYLNITEQDGYIYIQYQTTTMSVGGFGNTEIEELIDEKGLHATFDDIVNKVRNVAYRALFLRAAKEDSCIIINQKSYDIELDDLYITSYEECLSKIPQIEVSEQALMDTLKELPKDCSVKKVSKVQYTINYQEYPIARVCKKDNYFTVLPHSGRIATSEMDMCNCTNFTFKEGYYTCDVNGKPIELDSDYKRILYACSICGLMINTRDFTVVGIVESPY